MTSVELKKSGHAARRPDPVKSAAALLESDRVRESPAAFYSILFATPVDRVEEPREGPAFFADLNCDQVVDAIIAGKEEYDLKPFFYLSLHRVDAIKYRQEIMQELEGAGVLERVNAFAREMRRMREHLVRHRKLHYKEQKQAWFLEAVEIYCDCIAALANDLSSTELKSRGLSGFRDYLTSYAGSARFTSLLSETKKLKAELRAVKYCVLIKGDSFTVSRYDVGNRLQRDVEETFAKFKQGAVEDYRGKFSASLDMNHVEAKILEFVAKLHPEVFATLDGFCTRHENYLDEGVAAFDREVQFYLAYLDYVAPLKRAGLRFCYPRISDQTKRVFDHECFDIALARKLVSEKARVVCNDFHLEGEERILVISGPNQGGKTTFARTFGQLHYLASIGCPVPGKKARLFLFDRLFSHFEKEEKVENLRGKLEDDLFRIRDILVRATSRSIIVINEIFTSTTIQGRNLLEQKDHGRHDRARCAVRMGDVRRRTGVVRQADRLHGQHRRPGESDSANLQDRETACRWIRPTRWQSPKSID